MKTINRRVLLFAGMGTLFPMLAAAAKPECPEVCTDNKLLNLFADSYNRYVKDLQAGQINFRAWKAFVRVCRRVVPS